MARSFNRCGATRVVALDISKAFERVCYAGTLHKLKSYEWILWIQVAFDGKCSHKYPVNAGVPQGSILDPTVFLLYINDCPVDVICNIAVYDDDNSLYQKCDQASNLRQQLELTPELEFDQRDPVDWGRNWLIDFNTGKKQLILFDWSKNNNTSAIMKL